MSDFSDLDLIRLFAFYLWLVFFVSTFVCIRQYEAIVRLVQALPERWPSLFTLGYVNPRKIVHAEVRKALVETSKLLNTTLWWVSLQVSLRVAFGLTLWLTWAMGGSRE